jgi:hypothetical protein
MLEYSGVIVLSVLLQFTTFDYICGIFKLFSQKSNIASGYMKMGSIAGSRDPAIRYTAGLWTVDSKKKPNTYHLPTVTDRTRQK